MAQRILVGGRPVVEYSNTITIGGTWVAGETLNVTINNVALTLTIGTTTTTTTVASNLQKAWEGETLDAGYSANILGTQSGRHYELEASVSGSVVTVTERAVGGVTEGKTFPSLSVGETSTSGTIVLGTAVTPTGPHHFDDAANYLGGAVPADTDEIVAGGPYDIRYGLDQSGTPLATITLRILASFVGQFGLPRYRTVSLPGGISETFREYRQTDFKTNSGGTLTLTVGEGDGVGPTLVKIDSNTSDITATVYKTGTAPVDGEPAVFIAGSGTGGSQLMQYGGTVGLCYFDDDAAGTFGSVWVASPAGAAGGAVLVTGTSLAGTTQTEVTNAIATLNHALVASEIIIAGDGGTVNVRGTPHASAAIKAYGGLVNVDYPSGTLGTLNIAVGGDGFLGSVVIAGGLGNLTFSNCNIYSAGCSLIATGRRGIQFTNDIVLAAGLKRSQVTVDLPGNANAVKVSQAALP